MRLVDMRPVLTADYVLDRWQGHSEVSGDYPVFQTFAPHHANASNIIRRQTGSTIALTYTRAGASGRMSIASHRAPATLTNHVGNVVGLRAKEQVVGPDTGAVVAMVQDAHTARNRPIDQGPRHSMGSVYPTRSRESDHSISLGISVALPFPAGIATGDLFPEAFGERSVDRHRMYLR